MRRLLIPLALAAVATIPSTALAKAPQGTFSGPLQSGEDARASVTVDKGRVIGLAFTWDCNGDRVQTTIVSNAAGEGGATLAVKRGRFSVKRTAIVTQGSIGEPGFKEGKGAAQVSGQFRGSRVTGTFKGSGFGCTASGKFTGRPA
jgi:hypothetical protein